MQNPSLILSLRVSFIIAWNVEGELHNPKNMTIGSYNLRLVLNAAFHWSPSLMHTLLNPHQTSNLVKYLAPEALILSMISDMGGSG